VACNGPDGGALHAKTQAMVIATPPNGRAPGPLRRSRVGPYVTSDKDLRISWSATVESKHVSAELTFIKAQRDLEISQPRIKTNSKAGG
jgi:hypothetical protein